MNIAVIAWGSLLWNRGTLDVQTRWHGNGPQLPLEFARISCGGRLTLVLFPGAETRTTYWAASSFDNLDDSRRNLADREGSKIDAVHFYLRGPADREDQHSGHPVATAKVGEWLNIQDRIDAAIWTGLTSNWQSKRGSKFSVDDAVLYLAGLRGPELDAAREYITHAPPQVDTPVRRAMRARGWHDAILPAELFAESELKDDCS